MSSQIVPEMEQGRLYTLASDGLLTELDDKSNVSNGLAWAPDRRIMYHIDSVPGLLYAYDYDISTGEAGWFSHSIDRATDQSIGQTHCVGVSYPLTRRINQSIDGCH